MFKNILGFYIRLVVAGQFEAEWRLYHCHHGYWFYPAICNVWHGSNERTVWANGRPPSWNQDMSGGRLPGIRRVRHRTPVPKSGRTGAWLLLDGCLVGMLDGVSDRCAHGARIENGICAIRPRGV